MKSAKIITAFVALCALGITAWSIGPKNLIPGSTDSEVEIKDANAVDPNVVSEFRSQGTLGIEEFITENKGAFENGSKEETAKLHKTLDEIAGQKDSYYSRLYWHMDLDAALETARKEGKPVLSLRMLGDLREDLSCANSRMFRTILYPNKDVSAYLRDHYVLHWSSERQVPKVTIDFGDGRKMHTTVTGNSIHYVLDHAGKPIDGYPGLYSPSVFLNKLKRTDSLFNLISEMPTVKQKQAVKAYHEAIKAQAIMTAGSYYVAVGGAPGETIEALQVQALTVTKSGMELPFLQQLNPWGPGSGDSGYNTLDEEERWLAIAENLKVDGEVDENTIAMVRLKNPVRLSEENGEQVMIDAMKRKLTLESLRNEFSVQYTIHDWFATDKNTEDYASLNSAVYTDLFKTPRADEWLGLLMPEVYTGIDNDGIESRK